LEGWLHRGRVAGSVRGDCSLLARLHAWYASHSDAGLEAVASLQGLEERVYEALYPRVEGVVVLSTCNRFEVYVETDRPVEAWEALGQVLGVRAKLLRHVEGFEAARRIARIASGLESLILGEPEILGQVRSAWLKARERGFTSHVLDMVFHAALNAGRRARSETRIGEGSIGYPSAAVRIASERLGGLNDKSVLVVGTGEAAEAIVRIICSGDYGLPSRLVVAGRSLEKASRIASKCPRSYASTITAALDERFDAAFVAVSGAPQSLQGLPERAGLVLDISLPPAVPRASNVVGIDYIGARAREASLARASEVSHVEAIIEEELGRLVAKLREYRVNPVVEAVARYAALAAREEAGRTARRLGLDGEDAEYLEVAFRSLAKRLVHPLLEALRAAAREGEPALLPRLIRESYSKRLRGGGDGVSED
jgi:glutamyl-tRNA reductase